jgi:hypothetical protein
MSKSFVLAIRSNRKIKIFPEDLKRIFKIDKRKTPLIPSFNGKLQK